MIANGTNYFSKINKFIVIVLAIIVFSLINYKDVLWNFQSIHARCLGIQQGRVAILQEWKSRNGELLV